MKNWCFVTEQQRKQWQTRNSNYLRFNRNTRSLHKFCYWTVAETVVYAKYNYLRFKRKVGSLKMDSKLQGIRLKNLYTHNNKLQGL
jgi:hypothetical protein